MKEEKEIIKRLTGITDENLIKLHDDGFLSRGYVVDKGRIVFKFPKREDVTYDNEIEIINFTNKLNLGINLQKIRWISKENLYLGVYGVVGHTIDGQQLTSEQQQNIGNQLGAFLKKLHQAKYDSGYYLTLQEELAEWQRRYKSVTDFIKSEFSVEEQKNIDYLMMNYVPETLLSLGENLVFSHGDLGEGNIFLDENGKIGIIDFNESGIFDEAADFMDIDSDEIRNAMLDSYDASETLRKKVELKKDIRPIIVLDVYLIRGDKKIINGLVNKIRQTLTKYASLIEKN